MSLVNQEFNAAFPLWDSGLIGRVDELNLLQEAYQQAALGRGGLVYVEANSGGGKSRLVEEFRKTSLKDQNVNLFFGQGLQLSAARPFEALSGIFAEVISKARRDPEYIKELKRLIGINQLSALVEIIPEFSTYIDHSDLKELGPESFGEQRSIRAVKAILSNIGTELTPAVVILDDCQWLDDLAARVLLSCQRERKAGSLYTLFILAFRSEEVSKDHILRSEKPNFQIILRPFDKIQLRSWVETSIGRASDEVCDLIYRSSGGNPFLTATVAQSLIETNVIAKDAGSWRIVSSSSEFEDDRDNQHNFLKRRIEPLENAARQFLSIAAVFGKQFNIEEVGDLANFTREQVSRIIKETEHRYLIKHVTSVNYEFVHDMLRETILKLIDPEQKSEFHLQIARQIETSPNKRPFELAFHYFNAGRKEIAAGHALEAAHLARSRYSLETAERYYRIAESTVDILPRYQKRQILLGLGETLMLRGSYQEAEVYFRKARSCVDDPLSVALLEKNIGELNIKQGDISSAIISLERGLKVLGVKVPKGRLELTISLIIGGTKQALHTLFPKYFVNRHKIQPDERTQVICQLLNRLAYAQWFGKGVYWCFASHLKSLNIIEQYSPSPELAHCYSSHGPGMTMIPFYSRALKYTRKALEMQPELDNPWSLGQCLNFYGVTLYAASQFSECIAQCDEAVRVLEEAGDQWESNIANVNLIYAVYRLGYLDDAIKLSSTLYSSVSKLGDLVNLACCLAIWSKASNGKVPEELLEEGRVRVGEYDVLAYCEVAQARAISAMHNGDLEQAESILERAWQLRKDKNLNSEYVLAISAWMATVSRMKAEKDANPLNLKIAKKMVKQAVSIGQKYQNNRAHSYREAALVSMLHNKEKQARRNIEESLASARRFNMFYEEALSLDIRSKLAEIYKWDDCSQDKVKANEMLIKCNSSL